MRIIAGKHKGRKIETPRKDDVRPTSDYARESIFNVLTHGKIIGGESAVENARVLDLFCGTGALGLEALSRGAAHVTFIDQSREALNLARTSVTNFHEEENCTFLALDASQLSKNIAPPYNVVFLDPPYSKPLLTPALKRLLQPNWLEKNAILVAEHDERVEFTLPTGYEQLDRRRYGRTCVEFLRFSG